MTSIPKTICLDFGTKRVGVAISQASLAEPLVVLENNDSFNLKLNELCRLHEVKQVVVGISEGLSARRTQEFVAKIKEVIKLPIFITDETLSTQEAREKLKSAGKNIKYDTPVDHYAAAIILEDWLDMQVG
jgi:putative holliday junction resolvase